MTSAPLHQGMSPLDILRWYLDSGVDETIGETPVDRYAASSAAARAVPAAPAAGPPSPRQAPPPPAFSAPAAAPGEAPAGAASLARNCHSLEELRAALEAYDGCALRRTCQRTVFGTGDPQARVMVIGEAPGADEDRLGVPFVGASGRLLNQMLESIGLGREAVYITNVVPWRPPGNRKPLPTEVELCLPFVARHIELVAPRILLLLGGAAATALLARAEPISRLRGRWWDYAPAGLPQPVPAMPTYHPAYLLRTPAHKKEAWRDLLAVRKRLDGLP